MKVSWQMIGALRGSSVQNYTSRKVVMGCWLRMEALPFRIQAQTI